MILMFLDRAFRFLKLFYYFINSYDVMIYGGELCGISIDEHALMLGVACIGACKMV